MGQNYTQKSKRTHFQRMGQRLMKFHFSACLNSLKRIPLLQFPPTMRCQNKKKFPQCNENQQQIKSESHNKKTTTRRPKINVINFNATPPSKDSSFSTFFLLADELFSRVEKKEELNANLEKWIIKLTTLSYF